jgi:HTH-type transcriptional regulator / antitoxin MqsA
MTTFTDHRVWQDVYHVPARGMGSLREVPGGHHHRIRGHVFQGEMSMAVSTRDLPDTMASPETGETLRRGVRPFVVTYKGKSKTIELPGYYPENGDEGIHVGNDMAASDAALRALKEEIEGIPSPATIKRVRKKLKLSQREAGGLLKVGENAFDKYERGLVEPSGPTSQLLRLLDHHPELIEELRQGAA